MSNRVGMGQSRAEWPILSRPESVGADIKSRGQGLIPSRAESFGSDIESSRPRPMSS